MPASMTLHRPWRPRWIRESGALLRTLERPLGMISLTPLSSLSYGSVRERAPYYQGSLVLAGTSMPLEAAESSVGAARRAVLPFSVAEVRRALERPTASSSTVPTSPTRPASGSRRRVRRAAPRDRVPLSRVAERLQRGVAGMRRRGPLPRPALQEIGLAAPEGVPPVVMPVQEMPREMGPAPDVLSAEERPEPGRASPPLEVRRQAEHGAVEGAPSPERAEEGERRRPPVAAEGGPTGLPSTNVPPGADTADTSGTRDRSVA